METVQQIFIEKCKLKHGDKYDYSKVVYINTKKKITICCYKHGEFDQFPPNHLKGQGCKKCAIENLKWTQDEFIAKSKEVHNNKYDYSKVVYTKIYGKIIIICPIHGDFSQVANTHIHGSGCKKCGTNKIKTSLDDFIACANATHNFKYDYSKVSYSTMREKVIIICREHGEFLQIATSHVQGDGCPKCSFNAKLTVEDFIKRAKEVHGDKYDYSKVIYTRIDNKVIIICREHGEFTQVARYHTRGRGCDKCDHTSNRDDFIKKAMKIHGDKYDYSKVVYKNSTSKVIIICPDHGEFYQRPNSHLRGRACVRCCGKRLLSHEDFLLMAREAHGDTYDYSKITYIGGNTRVTMTCKIHGDFLQLPRHHIKGSGCPKCGIERMKITRDEFIERSIKMHGDKYDYSRVDYFDTVVKVLILCKKHGEFYQKPSGHLSGKGCKVCSYDSIRTTQDEFINKCSMIHNFKYDYTETKYIDIYTKITIKCPKHGDFIQKPGVHLKGSGCKRCNSSKGVLKIVKMLDDMNVEYELEKRFETCVNINTLRFDIDLPTYNCLIEFDGMQHFESVEEWGGEEGLSNSIKRDKIKDKWVKNNKIYLFRLSYKDINNIEMLMDMFFILLSKNKWKPGTIISSDFHEYLKRGYEILTI